MISKNVDLCAYGPCMNRHACHPDGRAASPWCWAHKKQIQRGGVSSMRPVHEKATRCCVAPCVNAPQYHRDGRIRSPYCKEHQRVLDL